MFLYVYLYFFFSFLKIIFSVTSVTFIFKILVTASLHCSKNYIFPSISKSKQLLRHTSVLFTRRNLRRKYITYVSFTRLPGTRREVCNYSGGAAKLINELGRIVDTHRASPRLTSATISAHKSRNLHRRRQFSVIRTFRPFEPTNGSTNRF